MGVSETGFEYMARLVLFSKPFNVLCQFTDGEGRPTLADWIRIPGIYAAGRLDRDSEGLVALTDDGGLIARIADPKHKLPKTYWVQVEGAPDEAALQTLRTGVRLNDGPTLPAKVRVIAPPAIPDRDPPIRFRKNDVTTWLELVISEGRNRQVRRMTAAVGFPTLRLVRYAIGDWTLEGLAPGEYREVDVALPAATVARGPRPRSGEKGKNRRGHGPLATPPGPSSAPRGKGPSPSGRPSGKPPSRRSRASRKGPRS